MYRHVAIVFFCFGLAVGSTYGSVVTHLLIGAGL